MRLGLLSDTHDETKRAARAVQALIDEGAEALVHCGDVTIPEVVHACAGLPSHFVFGNCDEDLQGLRDAVALIGGAHHGLGALIDLGGKRVAATHGDRRSEWERLMKAAPDYLVYGHTHVPSDRTVGATRTINPGAPHRAESYTVAVLDLETGALRYLNVR